MPRGTLCLAPFLWSHNIPPCGIYLPLTDTWVVRWRFSQYSQAQTLPFPGATPRLLGCPDFLRGENPPRPHLCPQAPALPLPFQPNSQTVLRPSRQGGAGCCARPLGLPAPPPAPALAHVPISGQGTEGESPAAKRGPGQLGLGQGSAIPASHHPEPAGPCQVTLPPLPAQPPVAPPPMPGSRESALAQPRRSPLPDVCLLNKRSCSFWCFVFLIHQRLRRDVPLPGRQLGPGACPLGRAGCRRGCLAAFSTLRPHRPTEARCPPARLTHLCFCPGQVMGWTAGRPWQSLSCWTTS